MTGPPSVPLPESEYVPLIERALDEDVGAGDATTAVLIPHAVRVEAVIRARQSLVVAGLWLVAEVLRRIDPEILVTPQSSDGDTVMEGAVLAGLTGDIRPILTAERTALNFLQRLSGIATETARFVDAIRGTRSRIMDTRKTTPGWRALEKYAVRMGGGANHRRGLDAGIMIKDNHIAYVTDIKEAVRRARQSSLAARGIVLEVKSPGQIEPAVAVLDPEKDVLMLDNFPVPKIRQAMEQVRGRVRVEASGGVTLANVREVADCGVDFISVGALTHSARAADIALDVIHPG